MSGVRDLLQLGLAAANLAAARPERLQVRSWTRAAIVGASVGMCAIVGTGCLLTSIWIYAIPYVGPSGAPLVVAAVLLVAATAMVAVTRQLAAPPPAVAKPAVDPALLLAEAARLTRAHQAPMLLAALIAGLELGKRA